MCFLAFLIGGFLLFDGEHQDESHGGILNLELQPFERHINVGLTWATHSFKGVNHKTYLLAGYMIKGVKTVIKKKALKAIHDQYPSESHRFEVHVKWMPRRLQKIRPSQIKAVKPAEQIERYSIFDVHYLENGKLSTAQIQLGVEVERYLPVPRHRLLSGSVIRNNDLIMRWVEVSTNKEDLVTKIDSLIGKTLQITHLAYQPMDNSEVGPKYLVKAGDMVELLFDHHGIRIALKGEARQSGAKGEVISIYSKETRKKYRGRIVSPGIAKWQETH